VALVVHSIFLSQSEKLSAERQVTGRLVWQAHHLDQLAAHYVRLRKSDLLGHPVRDIPGDIPVRDIPVRDIPGYHVLLVEHLVLLMLLRWPGYGLRRVVFSWVRQKHP
jgi:hypothetical protein